MNYFLIAFIILFDQITKYLIQSKFQLSESIPIIHKVFYLTYVHNYGAAFGIMQNQKLFFIVTTSLVIVGIIFFLRSQGSAHKVLKYGLTLIVGGAVGNLIDRVQFGYVRDFFDFRIWPVFNIADMAIVFGAILLCYFIIFLDTTHE